MTTEQDARDIAATVNAQSNEQQRALRALALAANSAADVVSDQMNIIANAALVLADKLKVDKPVEPPTKFKSGLPFRSGCCMGNNMGGLNAFAAWRNRPNDITMAYTGGKAWGKGVSGESASVQWGRVLGSSNTKSGGVIENFMNEGLEVVYGQALLVNAESGEFARVLNGELDGQHQQIANNIANWLLTKGEDYPRLYWCTGQEQTGGYPWSISSFKTQADLDAYCNAYKRISKIYDDRLNVGGKKRVWFSFNLMYNFSQADRYIAKAYPGQANSGGPLSNYDPIDYITGDTYNNASNGSPFESVAEFENWMGTNTATANGGKGPRGMLAYAKFHGKKFGIQEWAPAKPLADQTQRWNNSIYFDGIWQWYNEIAKNAPELEMFEIFFNQTTPLLSHQIHPVGEAAKGLLEKASAAYLAKWQK